MPAALPGADKVVFGLVAAENGFRLMGYDIPGQTEAASPAVDAMIVEPLSASAWSAGFGMLTDRFGVTWSVSVAAE